MSAYDEKLSALEERMGYRFSDRELLIRSLTHGSYGDGRRKFRDNQRLEFLGDRILGMLTADMLFSETAGEEGQLARRLNSLVNGETCADIARVLDLGSVIRMSKSVIKQGGRDNTSILGDACEALLAAIYFDGGWEPAKVFYLTHWKRKIVEILKIKAKDAKTELQERAARYGVGLPDYQLEAQSGPDHKPQFFVRVSVDGIGSAEGRGQSKKEAERLAAAELLKTWPPEVKTSNVKTSNMKKNPKRAIS